MGTGRVLRIEGAQGRPHGSHRGDGIAVVVDVGMDMVVVVIVNGGVGCKAKGESREFPAEWAEKEEERAQIKTEQVQ